MVLAGDANCDLARQAWNLAADQRPAAVALPESADEVRSIVDQARARDLRIAPQATGHGALSLGPLADTILLSTTRIRGVQIDPLARRATMFWPIARAREILGAWRAWTDGLPEELRSIVRVRRMPPRPHVPERLRRRSFAIVEAA